MRRRSAWKGLSRFGKAALVAEAFEPRVAVGLVGSSGEGGAKLHRHIFGEAVENLAGGEYYWMAGNFIKYGASDPPKTAADLPVDSHELIALCAPRPCFISYGVIEHGDAKWVDAHGSFMAAVLASPVYELLGAKGLGTPGNYLTDPMPPTLTLIGGQLAWRQHEGGHDVTPNWPAFFGWVSRHMSRRIRPRHRPPRPAHKRIRRAFLRRGRMPIRCWRTSNSSPKPKPAGSICISSATRSRAWSWGCSDPQWTEMLANWKQNFFGWNAANFGWGGDRIQNMLWRIQNGELDGVNPKVIVILAGTNNVGNQPAENERAADEKVADIVSGIRTLIGACHEKAPGAKILVTAIFPRNDNPAVLPEIRRIDDELAKLVDGRQIYFVNINDTLANSDGVLFEGMTVDKLHLTAKGYQAWADGLRPILTELLGAPAKTDHAPPATGDPSSVRPAGENR